MRLRDSHHFTSSIERLDCGVKRDRPHQYVPLVPGGYGSQAPACQRLPICPICPSCGACIFWRCTSPKRVSCSFLRCRPLTSLPVIFSLLELPPAVGGLIDHGGIYRGDWTMKSMWLVRAPPSSQHASVYSCSCRPWHCGSHPRAPMINGGSQIRIRPIVCPSFTIIPSAPSAPPPVTFPGSPGSGLATPLFGRFAATDGSPATATGPLRHAAGRIRQQPPSPRRRRKQPLHRVDANAVYSLQLDPNEISLGGPTDSSSPMTFNGALYEGNVKQANVVQNTASGSLRHAFSNTVIVSALLQTNSPWNTATRFEHGRCRTVHGGLLAPAIFQPV